MKQIPCLASVSLASLGHQGENCHCIFKCDMGKISNSGIDWVLAIHSRISSSGIIFGMSYLWVIGWLGLIGSAIGSWRGVLVGGKCFHCTFEPTFSVRMGVWRCGLSSYDSSYAEIYYINYWGLRTLSSLMTGSFVGSEDEWLMAKPNDADFELPMNSYFSGHSH